MAAGTEEIETIRELLSDNPSESFLQLIASAVKDELEDSIPELTLNSKPMIDALDDFREIKLAQVGAKSHYKRKLTYVESYLVDVKAIGSTGDLTSEIVQQYTDWRKYDSLDRDEPLSNVTLQDDMYLFREFIRYLVEHRFAPVRFLQIIEIPKTNPEAGEGVDEKMLDPELASTIRDYLGKYHYASVDHVVMELFCEVGARKSGLRSLDIGDFSQDGNDWILQFEHREGTNLKNDLMSSRDLTLHGELPNILQDYIEDRRPDVTDEDGRKPLLTKGKGRIGKSTLKTIAYRWTRPCKVGLDCPHDRDPTDCEAAQTGHDAYQCPSSRAPHHIRKGYITAMRNAGVSSDAIDQRCDVSKEVQDRHYDLPSQSDRRRRFDDEFRAASAVNQGFGHRPNKKSSAKKATAARSGNHDK